MKYILDTNVCIQILRGASSKVKEKISAVQSADIAIPSIVRFELLYGAHKSSNPQKKLAVIREFITSFASIPVDDQIADKCGEIRATLEKVGRLGITRSLLQTSVTSDGKILSSWKRLVSINILFYRLHKWVLRLSKT